MKYADYIERKQRGSIGFPIQYYFVDEQHPQYEMTPHWHKEFEIIRVLKGKFTVFLNSVPYKLHPGDVLLVGSGYLHSGIPKDSVYECIVFDLNMLTKQKSDITQKYITPLFNSMVDIKALLSSSCVEIINICNELFSAMREQQDFYELKIYGLLFLLFAGLYHSGYIVPKAKSHHNHQTDMIIHLVDWIERNFAEELTLEKLSEVSGFSQKYLCRIFKEYTSKTLVAYINELRIENACFGMLVEGKSITRAAFDSGFNDLSYFCKVFKRQKGVTPNAYKRQAGIVLEKENQ